jgi:hypothetical protein
MRILTHILFAASLAAAPVPVTFAWNYQPQPLPDHTLSFRLYSHTNVAEPTVNWQLITNFPAYQGEPPAIVTTITVQLEPGMMFFFLTSSNMWDGGTESTRSNITNTPALSLPATLGHPRIDR